MPRLQTATTSLPPDDGVHRAFGRQDWPAERFVLGGWSCHRQSPFVGTCGAVQGQFAECRVLGDQLGSDLPAADEPKAEKSLLGFRRSHELDFPLPIRRSM
ncbi:MAG: hypothetical protein ACLP9L_24110 [Thermoguttaceae bacterium]